MSNKKFYLVCMAVLVSVSLFVIGCPTEASDGKDGAPGTDGNDAVSSSPASTGPYVRDVELERDFALWDTVQLSGNVYSVYGTVPAGKKLIVLGETAVFPGQSLTVEGTLEVGANAVLTAIYTSSSGYLVSTGTITGTGSLVLPVFAASSTPKPDNNVVAFDSNTGTVKQAIGSYNTAVASAAPAGPLSPANIATLFATTDTDALTAGGFTGLNDTAIPAGKKLTLTGYNNLAVGLDLSGKTGAKLIVAEGATLSTGGSGGAVKGDITIEAGGTLTLGNVGDSVGDGVTNNGTILVEAALTGTGKTDPATLLGVAGSGTVKFENYDRDSGFTAIANTLTINTTPVALKQHVVIGNSATLTVSGTAQVPFSSAAAVTQSVALALTTTPSQPITIDVGGVLALPATATGIGVAVENNGTISTLTQDTAVVIDLLKLKDVTGSGVIKLAATVVLNAKADLSVQDVVIGNSAALTAHSIAAPFSGTKKIINEGTLTLPAAVTSVGVDVVNGNGNNAGTVRTAATAELAAVLDTISKDYPTSTIELTSPITATTPISIVSAGTVTFSNAAAPVFGAGSSIKAKIINFVNGLKAAGAVTLAGGDVIIPAGTAPTGTIAFDATGIVALEAGTTILESTGGTKLLKADGGKAELKATAATTLVTVTATALTTSGSGITFDGPVAFGGGLSLGVPATFNGNVSVADGKAIVLTATTATITLGAGVYLGLPTADGVPAVYGSVIHNPSADNVVLTPTEANTKLTFSDDADNGVLRTITQANSGTGAHGISIAGTASLPAGATYLVASVNGSVGTLTIANTSELSLAAGYLVSADEDKANGHNGASSKLVLTGAATGSAALLKGPGKVVLGKASITGGSTGSWEAVSTGTDTIALGVGTITGSASGLALTGGTDDSATITLATGNADGDAATLTVTSATIDIATKGTVTFPWVANNPARLVLKGGSTAGALLLNSSNSTINANRYLKDGTHTVAISGPSGIVVQGASGDASAAAGTISGGISADATILGNTADNTAVTIKAGATLESAGS